MRTMIKYALAFLCLSILSCGSKESKYVEIKEPENTKKIIETRCYKEGPEIDGDYIPGDELLIPGDSRPPIPVILGHPC